ncbi:MAG: DUF938 domain-containing protein [Halomonadaceae bacterium]|nr:MAG: DUF938 domain-containing protein [Halomonadaceae bacterium]
MGTTDRPFSPACERNQGPILACLRTLLPESARVLEIGSGTGQHGVHFCAQLEHLQWQPSEVPAALPDLQRGLEGHGLDNLLPPMPLDVNAPPASITTHYDAVFTANTVHFVAWSVALNLLECSAVPLREGGQLLVYGPFNDEGVFTSEGNRQLDIWLKSRAPQAGIRDWQALEQAARAQGLTLVMNHSMPANNRLLQFRRQART